MKLTLVALALFLAVAAAVPEAEPEALFGWKGRGRWGGGWGGRWGRRGIWGGRWGRRGLWKRSADEEPEMKEEEDKTVAVAYHLPHNPFNQQFITPTAFPYAAAYSTAAAYHPYATAYNMYNPYMFNGYHYNTALNAFGATPIISNVAATTTHVVAKREAEAEPLFWRRGGFGRRWGRRGGFGRRWGGWW